MAEQKRKVRETKVTSQEKAIQIQLDHLSKVKMPSDVQKQQAKTLRGQLAPMRFKRIAEMRVPRAVKAIRGLGNLAGAGYMHTEEQAEKILTVLTDAVKFVESRLIGGKETEEGKFTL